MSSKQSKTVRDQTIIGALGTQFKAGSVITVNGNDYKATDLQTQFQAEVDAAKATQSAKTVWAQAVLAEKKVSTQVTLIRKGLRFTLIGNYGPESAIVAAFGFTPKATTVDVATKSVAIEKRAATRAARGTKGSRQKKEITGAKPVASAAAPTSATVSAPVAPVASSTPLQTTATA
jgi:uncharacterized Zn finger protein